MTVGFSGAASPGDSGGRTVSFTSFSNSWSQLFWGPASNALPAAGLDNTLHVLAFSGISGTTATWAGTSNWTNPTTGLTHTVPIQMRITVSGLGGSPWVLSTSVAELDPGPGTGIGAVVDDSTSLADFSANVQFLADIPTDGPGFIALNSVQNAGGQTLSSYTGAFYERVLP